MAMAAAFALAAARPAASVPLLVQVLLVSGVEQGNMKVAYNGEGYM